MRAGLWARGVRELMVEGGPATARRFLEARRVDRCGALRPKRRRPCAQSCRRALTRALTRARRRRGSAGGGARGVLGAAGAVRHQRGEPARRGAAPPRGARAWRAGRDLRLGGGGRAVAEPRRHLGVAVSPHPPAGPCVCGAARARPLALYKNRVLARSLSTPPRAAAARHAPRRRRASSPSPPPRVTPRGRSPRGRAARTPRAAPRGSRPPRPASRLWRRARRPLGPRAQAGSATRSS